MEKYISKFLSYSMTLSFSLCVARAVSLNVEVSDPNFEEPETDVGPAPVIHTLPVWLTAYSQTTVGD